MEGIYFYWGNTQSIPWMSMEQFLWKVRLLDTLFPVLYKLDNLCRMVVVYLAHR